MDVADWEKGKDRMLRWFGYAHLPVEKQSVSRPFHDLAHEIDRMMPPGPERTAGLRKLLEAKDCIVRAHMEAFEPVGVAREGT